MHVLDWSVDKYLHRTHLSLFGSCLLPPSPFFLLLPPPPPPTLSSPLQHLPVLSHFCSNSVVTRIQYSCSHTHTHTWSVCGNGRSVLRPCWGAADWSCTDLPPGPWGFVTHVCGAGLNTFSPRLCLSFTLSLQRHKHLLLLCYAVQCPSCSYTSHPLSLSVFCR